MNFFGQTGAFFIALVFGKLADLTKSYNTPLLIIGTMLVTGGFAWLFIDPENKIAGGHAD